MAKFYIEHYNALSKKKEKIVLEGIAAQVNLEREPDNEDFLFYADGNFSYPTQDNVTITLEGVRLGEKEPVDLPRFFVYWRDDTPDLEIVAQYHRFEEFNGDTLIKLYKDTEKSGECVAVLFARDIRAIVKEESNG